MGKYDEEKEFFDNIKLDSVRTMCNILEIPNVKEMKLPEIKKELQQAITMCVLT